MNFFQKLFTKRKIKKVRAKKSGSVYMFVVRALEDGPKADSIIKREYAIAKNMNQWPEDMIGKRMATFSRVLRSMRQNGDIKVIAQYNPKPKSKCTIFVLENTQKTKDFLLKLNQKNQK